MKIAIYARVSSKKQENEKTIDSQVEALEKYAKEKNYIIIDKYKDNGFSGTLLARPELDRLRDDVLKKIFEAVLIYSPDRLARKYIYQELIIEELKNKNVQTIFLNRPIAETPEDQLLLGVQGIIAEYERAKIIERTRRGRLHRAKSNHIIGNISPYGYICILKSKSKKDFAYYKINEEEAKIVRLMFNWLVNEQLTTYQIIRRLQQLGIKARKGNRWARSSVHKILKNETYSGTTYYNKHYGVPSKKQNKLNGEVKYQRRKNNSIRFRPTNEWIAITGIPVIINKELFLKAQEQLKLNQKLANRNTKFQYLLKGLLKCGNDNGSLYGTPCHGKRYYRCYYKSKLNSETGCSTPTFKAETIENIIWQTVENLLNNPKSILEQYNQRKKQIESGISNKEERTKNVENQLILLKNEENRLLNAFSSGAITLDQLKEQNSRLLSGKKRLENERKTLETLSTNSNQKEPTLKEIGFYLKYFSYAFENLDFEKKQKILRLVLKEVEIKNRKAYIRGILPPKPSVTLCPQPPS